MADTISCAQRRSARSGWTALVAVGAAFMLVSPVAAQSPSPSTAPGTSPSAVPAEPVAPSAAATTLTPLQALEATFAAQACDPLLSAAEVSSASGLTVSGVAGGRVVPFTKRKDFIGLDCTWSVDGGTISLKVEERQWKGKGKPKTKDFWDKNDRGYTPDETKLAGPGEAAYSDPGSERGYYPGRPNVTWSVWLKHGKAYADRWVGLVSDVVDVTALEALANVVRSDATPGDAPIATAPGDAAAPLVGSWALSGVQGVSLFAEPPATTITFDDTGTVTTSFDCEGFDGKKPVVLTDLYFVDGDRIAMVTDVGSDVDRCFDQGAAMGAVPLARGFDDISDATWAVAGDTLVLTGPDDLYAWTFERAAD